MIVFTKYFGELNLKGYQIAYILKRKDPKLYDKARTIKEAYGLKWEEAIKIAKGEIPEPMTLNDLTKRIEDLENQIKTIREALDDVKVTLKYRIETCKHVDQEGYCTKYNWIGKKEHWKVREDIVKGELVYHVKVTENRFLCLGCPYFSPRRWT
jgi:hypothetical protein